MNTTAGGAFKAKIKDENLICCGHIIDQTMCKRLQF